MIWFGGLALLWFPGVLLSRVLRLPPIPIGWRELSSKLIIQSNYSIVTQLTRCLDPEVPNE